MSVRLYRLKLLSLIHFFLNIYIFQMIIDTWGFGVLENISTVILLDYHLTSDARKSTSSSSSWLIIDEGGGDP